MSVMTCDGATKGEKSLDDPQAGGEISSGHELASAEVVAFQDFLTTFVQSRLPSTLLRNVGVSDIVQSVFCRVEACGDQFRGSTAMEFRGWLVRIAERKIIDALRRYRTRPCPLVPPDCVSRMAADAVDEETPSELLAVQEQARLLLRALERLPDDVRAIVTLRHVREMTFEEIANELSIPVTTCRRRWLAGLKLLGKELGPLIG